MMKPVRDPANSSGHWAQAQVVYAEETMRVILHLSAFSMVPGAAVAAMTEPIPEPGHRALRLEERFLSYTPAVHSRTAKDPA